MSVRPFGISNPNHPHNVDLSADLAMCFAFAQQWEVSLRIEFWKNHIPGPRRLRFCAATAFFCLLVASGCSSTIHTQSNLGGVDTLSVDAKQRLVFVGTRESIDAREPSTKVTCTEPSPDALVAQAAVIAANLSVTAPTGSYGGSGNLNGGVSESAAAIGYRDHSVQMLRDGYFRLCEAYMNGALSRKKYEHMITNTDTFLAVASAMQLLGPNVTAPNTVISGGSVQISKDGTIKVAQTPGEVDHPGAASDVAPPPKRTTVQAPKTATTGARSGTDADVAKAWIVGQIVHSYLGYRERMNTQLLKIEEQEMKAKQRKP